MAGPGWTSPRRPGPSGDAGCGEEERGRVTQLLGAARTKAPGQGDSPEHEGGGRGQRLLRSCQPWGLDELAPASAPPCEVVASRPPKPTQLWPSGASALLVSSRKPTPPGGETEAQRRRRLDQSGTRIHQSPIQLGSSDHHREPVRAVRRRG